LRAAVIRHPSIDRTPGTEYSTVTSKERLTPEEADAQRKKETLLLARARLLQQLQNSQNPRHREIIERALADLEKLVAAADGLGR
jgi:hypothetical protein